MLKKLLADPRLAGCQHFAFKEYKDAKEAQILGGHANGIQIEFISKTEYSQIESSQTESSHCVRQNSGGQNP